MQFENNLFFDSFFSPHFFGFPFYRSPVNRSQPKIDAMNAPFDGTPGNVIIPRCGNSSNANEWCNEWIEKWYRGTERAIKWTSVRCAWTCRIQLNTTFYMGNHLDAHVDSSKRCRTLAVFLLMIKSNGDKIKREWKKNGKELRIPGTKGKSNFISWKWWTPTHGCTLNETRRTRKSVSVRGREGDAAGEVWANKNGNEMRSSRWTSYTNPFHFVFAVPLPSPLCIYSRNGPR